MATVGEREARAQVLRRLGGDSAALEQILTYCDNQFRADRVPLAPLFPLAEEGHVESWRGYVSECAGDAFAYLRQRLPQLCIPIGAGRSQSAAYAAVIKRGQPFAARDFDGATLALRRPEDFRFTLYEHPAGALPVLMTPHRDDFETLDRALAFRGEPVAINPAVNAQLIAGLINWDRVRHYRATWTATHLGAGAAWGKEMARVAATEKWRFYDRLMLVCENFYSGVDAAELGLDCDAASWLAKSTTLRLEHEFTHYTTKRLYGLMRLNMFDETIADWAGITAALGGFKAHWFIKFLGLGEWPRIDPGGRIHVYRDNLNDAALRLLCALLIEVAEGLAALTRDYYRANERMRFLLALTRLTLELIASDDRDSHFAAAYHTAGCLLGDN